MPYPKCKIYSDGGHYIAIPHTTRPYRPRKKPKEEVIAVTEEVDEETQPPAAEQSAPSIEDAPMPHEETVSDTADCTEIADTLPEKPTANRLMTKKELFEELYAKSIRACRAISGKPPSSNGCARTFPTRKPPACTLRRIHGAKRAISSHAACV